MWLRELQIRNFRKIDALTMSFPHGLTVLVGENNSGKTTIIDALRLMLFPSRDLDSLRLTEDDFRAGTAHAPIEISCRFTGLEDEDEVHFQECLVDIGDGKFEMQVNARVEFNETTNRCNVKMWGGETEGGSLPSNHYDRLATIYLQPLRDPERGLRPGQHSQVSRLIDCLTKEDQRAGFETIAKEANEKIRALKPVEDARGDINAQMAAIAGSELTQKTELIFTDPTFRRIIAGLQPEIEGLPFALNGLGYNNLIFTSATLGTLRRSPQFSFRSILVEEPEAHLHPQLQMLLLKHLADVASNHEGNEVQVIASSHSPILASQAPIDSVISVHEVDGKVSAVSVCSITIDDKIKKKLQRYLDATRGELFFARRILMVEGIAEALLLPVLAKIAGGNLKESSVTVLNADGINFNAFIPLLADVLLPGGAAPKIGEKFVQRDLAGVIRRMVNAERKARSRGRLAGLQAARDAFYVGPIARKIASFFRERGGFLAADDLARFLPKVEAPVSVRYKDFTLYMCPPWSQGPILLQALKLLERGSPLTSSSSLNV